jgi:nucleotide-binding universal stress UspA family protein
VKKLLAIDESPSAEVAVREVEERFGQDTTVRVLHVIEKFVPPASTLWYDAGGNPEAAHAEVVDRYQPFVDEVAQRLTSKGISIETVVKEGDPKRVIIQEARKWHADLIVLGWHGHGKLRRLVTGDVSQYVIDHAPCSVEIVHQKELSKDE